MREPLKAIAGDMRAEIENPLNTLEGAVELRDLYLSLMLFANQANRLLAQASALKTPEAHEFAGRVKARLAGIASATSPEKAGG
jgi:hypothetical protein